MTKKRVKFLKPGYYNCNYPAGSVVEVDENFYAYAHGMGDVEDAKSDDKITDPIPYVMAPRVAGAEDALAVIANSLASLTRPVMPSAPEKTGDKSKA